MTASSSNQSLFHFYRRIAAFTSLIIGAVYMIWKIRDSRILADRRFSHQEQIMFLSSSSKKNNHNKNDNNNSDVIEASSKNDNAQEHIRRRQLMTSFHHTAMVIPYERPKINTFYAPVLHHPNTANSHREERIFQADQHLLEEWKLAWYQAGWEPIVLTLEHAKQHPMFDMYWERFGQNIHFLGGRNEEFHRYSLLRFLAMASVGGGLMGDYDMMPLVESSTLPYFLSDGPSDVPQQQKLPTEFTVYEDTPNNADGTPSFLASGSAEEWQRMADSIWNLAETTEQAPDGWSDMLAIMQLGKKNPNAYRLHNDVLGYKEVMDGVAKQADNLCTITSNYWAIHFSHHDVQSQGCSTLDRPQVVHEFMMNYNTKCHAGSRQKQSMRG